VMTSSQGTLGCATGDRVTGGGGYGLNSSNYFTNLFVSAPVFGPDGWQIVADATATHVYIYVFCVHAN
jgi:hypothetical protein